MLTEEEKLIVKESYNKATVRDNKTMTLSHIDDVFDKYNFWGNNNIPGLFKIGFGEIILYQESKWNDKEKLYVISYPKIAVHIETLPCDQTLEFRYVDRQRTWMWNVEYISNPDTKYGNGEGISICVAEKGSEIKSTMPWGSTDFYIFGKWNYIPDWKQLKLAYEKTIWFYSNTEQLRDRAIASLL